jgi:hypothetical protein
VSPAFLFLLFGAGAALAASKKKTAKPAGETGVQKRIASSCTTKNGALWVELGPLDFKLPSNMSVKFADHRGDESKVTECGSFHTAPWLIELDWYEGGDFSRTRDLIKFMADWAQDISYAHFLCTVHLFQSKVSIPPTAELFASVKGWTPDRRGPEPGALLDTTGLFIDKTIDLRGDIFTDLQYAVGQVNIKRKLYRAKGNSVVWFEGDVPDSFPPETCEPYMSALVGEAFLPSGSVAAMEAPTLAQVLAMPGNTAWGYVDWLLYNDSKLEPKLEQNDVESASSYIALKILHESGVPCDVYSFEWVTLDGVKVFYDWLLKAIKPWVSDHLGGVPFEG